MFNTPPEKNKSRYNSVTYSKYISRNFKSELTITSRQNEIGRSMSEMLLMLTIMGILSVVGVLALNHAVDKNKANTLIYEAGKRAAVVISQIETGKNPSLSEFTDYNTFSGGTFNSKVFYKDDGLTNQFGIKVENVKKEVCQNILNTIGSTTAIRYLSKENDITTSLTRCDSNEGSYIIVYNGDMTTDDCTTNADCDVCSVCQIAAGATKGICVNECKNTCEVGDSCGENDCLVCDSETKTCQNKCVEVGWLESDGTQYIDTGINKFAFKRNDVIKAGIEPTYVSGTGYFFGFIIGSRGFALRTRTNTWIQSGIWQLGGPSDSNVDTIFKKFDIELSTTDGFILDGTKQAEAGADSGIPILKNVPYFPLYLGAYAQATNSTTDVYTITPKACRFYYVKVYQDNVLVRDFIPVLAPEESEYGKIPCMFDKVSKKLFCGTGTFDYGPKN